MQKTPQPDTADEDHDLDPSAEASASPSAVTLSSRKRPASHDASAGQARKRAPTACHTCKSRKVKCSNDRPQCVGCVRLGCECVYPEQNYRLQVDPNSSMILHTLNEILDRLPPRDGSPAAPPVESRIPSRVPHGAPLPTSSYTPDVSLDASPVQYQRKPVTACDEPSEYMALDSVFRWPIFADSSATRWSRQTLFIADQEPGHNDLLTRTHGSTRLPLLNDFDDIVFLIHQFLRHVHIKNPVLDSKTLLGDTRIVAETGPLWDTRSCLVLLAAALGAIAAPFDPTIPPEGTPLGTSSHDLEARVRGEAYYHSARRRFGLLDRSMAACQCYLLSGIYLMYTIRPLQAWQSFNQASTVYLVYLKSHGRFGSEGNQWNDTQTLSLRSLEQRLYWSCLKSESEIRNEVPLPPSGLSEINYPHMFPSPPSADMLNIPLPNEFAAFSSGTLMAVSPQSTSTASSDSMDHALLHEQSWFYYLTEVSLLRLSNRIVQYFYSAESSSWLQTNILNMINAAEEFESQLEGWKESLPVPIRFWDPNLAPDKYTELHIATSGRYLRLKRLTYRPFLYRYVHLQAQDTLLRDVIQSYAEKCVQACFEPTYAVGQTHRHHGSWFRCREDALAALTLLSAKKAGLLKSMGMEMQAEYFLRTSINRLTYWEEESPDVKLARQIIELMCTEYSILDPSLH
ncbi:hypothetical protein B0J13DRAFT_538669 [Dactylonectria estremocensis]|uniref:Zn(2)-C6 fungal-type domain-containing protein n=1 Tax=Dactylonectria estremocensis TaxID=1079267 RepID=A0A9P9FL66_9HYPO|nr:hypothetical protein B0J13DRAFT_538669 [Dactylonectria estremocensis]